jgi:hypothetical protein
MAPALPGRRRMVDVRSHSDGPTNLPGNPATAQASQTVLRLTTLRRLVDDGTSVTQAARTRKISRSTAYAALASTC